MVMVKTYSGYGHNSKLIDLLCCGYCASSTDKAYYIFLNIITIIQNLIRKHAIKYKWFGIETRFILMSKNL